MTRILRTIGWGLFCTSSWTWCIGMWLPMIVIARWGWPGFWVFAVPNVLGCAAMGYIVGSKTRSERLVETHRGPMRWFSVFTIGFQLFWLTAVLAFMGIDWTWLVIAPVGVLVLGAVAALMPSACWLLFSAAIFIVVAVNFGFVGIEPLETITDGGLSPAIELWGVAPLITLGFLFSPYLDLTFHRARRETPCTNSFAIFGATFLLVLLFVCAVWKDQSLIILLVLWAGQLIFTIGAHLRELLTSGHPGGWGSNRVLVVIACLPAALAWILLGMGCGQSTLFDPDTGAGHPLLVDMYLRFIAFYGLIVPAWVLAFMGPRRPARRTTTAGAVLVIALLLALPMAELGMIHSTTWTTTWWCIPAVAIVMLAALLLPRPTAAPRS
jgi:hypothetical protein